MATCSWCGKELPGKKRRCDDCRRLASRYRKGVAAAHSWTPLSELLELRNLLYDMKFNMPGATELPYDLDYQLDRVNRYIRGTTTDT